MRVVFAPDKFAGTLSALEAAQAMADGWARRAPDDVLVQVPMSDGGPGFVDVLHAALGGELQAVTVDDPYGAPVPAAVLRVGDTAYLECAQAVGLHLTERKSPAIQAFGRGLVKGMPVVMSVLTVVGTAAMVWVGGQIIVHGIEDFGLTTIPHFIHDAAAGAAAAVPVAKGVVNWVVNAALSGVVGLILGGAIALGLHAVKKPKAH